MQQLQFAVKNVTVGKTATFTKVDNVINETKNLMSVITKVVAACLNCANKVNYFLRSIKPASNDHQRNFSLTSPPPVQPGHAGRLADAVANPFTIVSGRLGHVLRGWQHGLEGRCCLLRVGHLTIRNGP